MRDRDEPNMNHLSVVGWPYRWMIRGTNQSLDMTRTVAVPFGGDSRAASSSRPSPLKRPSSIQRRRSVGLLRLCDTLPLVEKCAAGAGFV
jgi:hypothetical protein